MMKKITLLFSLLLATTFGFSQDLVLTGVVDGPLPGGTPKGIELYVINDIADLSIYGVGAANNGGGTDGEEYTFPMGASASAGDYIYLDDGSLNGSGLSNFEEFFGFPATYDAGSAAGVNGDDAIELFMNGNVVDVFGDINTDGSGQPWDYLDGWVYRVSGTGPDGTTFVLDNWTYSGINALDGETSNSTAATPFPIGTYSQMANTNPTISVGGNVADLEYFANNYDPITAEGQTSVGGSNLGADITLTAPMSFQISLTSGSGFVDTIVLNADGNGDVANTTIYVRLNDMLAVGMYSGNIDATSTGADTQMIAVSGEVRADDPAIVIFDTEVDGMNYPEGGTSTEDQVNVNARFLTEDITVTATTNFEVSLTSVTGFGTSVTIPQNMGDVEDVLVYTRLASGLTQGQYTGTISFASSGETETLPASGTVFAASPTGDLVLTGIMDGPLSGGLPKVVELYALNDIADLSFYGVSRASNGGGSSAGDIGYTFPADAVSAGTYITITNSAAGFMDYFGTAATYVSGEITGNGDDAYELYDNGVINDVFGDVNTDGSGEPWEYTDGWAYRNDDTGPDGNNFVIGNWSFSGVDSNDGQTTNAGDPNPFPISTYTNVLGTTDINGSTFVMFPNPSSNGDVNIITEGTNTSVAIFSILGKKVLSETLSSNRLNVSALQSGIYLVKVTQDGNTTTQKLIVR